MGTKGAPHWPKDFQSRLVLAVGPVFRRRAQPVAAHLLGIAF